MKKILLLSLILIAFCGQSSFAVDVYEIPKINPAFEFNVFNQGEMLVDDNENVTSVFTMNENQLKALFDAAENWDYILNTIIDPDKLPSFSVTTTKDFNAYASSAYVSVKGSNYLITEINAFINNKKIS